MYISSTMMRSSFYRYITTNTVGSYGNVVEGITLKSGPFRCCLTYLGGQKQLYAGKLNIVATHKLYCDPLDITSSDKVYVVGIGFFNVQYIDNPAQHNNHYQILLERIEEPQILDESSSSSSSEDYSSSSSENYSTSSSSSESSGVEGLQLYAVVFEDQALWQDYSGNYSYYGEYNGRPAYLKDIVDIEVGEVWLAYDTTTGWYGISTVTIGNFLAEPYKDPSYGDASIVYGTWSSGGQTTFATVLDGKGF